MEIKQLEFKAFDGYPLTMNMYRPNNPDGEIRGAMIFFFGGGWTKGSVAHFRPQATELARLGMIAFTPDYRVFSRHNTAADTAVLDAIAATVFITKNAEALGIDKNKIAAGGGSAGGHLAASVAILNDLAKEYSDAEIKINAMVLFNPVLDTTERGYQSKPLMLMNRPFEDLSPIHHIRPGLPDTLIFHGTADTVVPFENSQRFQRLMKENGNNCELVAYEGKGHGFFNMGPDRGVANYYDTLSRMVGFLLAKGLWSFKANE
ncbi:MAG: Acetylxylan esterase precursor [Firmicutes bacterium ADurb.Bin193]|nr:MAG: Acetylxylan esterase precursor [Firmicutes bacterium ADurb.Bin193]